MSDHHSHLAWVDIETTGLPTDHDGVIDFTDVHILEVAVIVTDRALNIHEVGGFVEVVKLTTDAANALRGNEVVRQMHAKSGLIKDSVAATLSLPEVDAATSAFLSEVGIAKGKFACAGSGIATFDLPLIRAKMPETASWLAYYPYDIGIFRRLANDLSGRPVVNPRLDSYGDAKLHRALSDVTAHLREAQRYRDWLRSLPEA